MKLPEHVKKFLVAMAGTIAMGVSVSGSQNPTEQEAARISKKIGDYLAELLSRPYSEGEADLRAYVIEVLELSIRLAKGEETL